MISEGRELKPLDNSEREFKSLGVGGNLIPPGFNSLTYKTLTKQERRELETLGFKSYSSFPYQTSSYQNVFEYYWTHSLWDIITFPVYMHYAITTQPFLYHYCSRNTYLCFSNREGNSRVSLQSWVFTVILSNVASRFYPDQLHNITGQW